jgi:hypothetical protein
MPRCDIPKDNIRKKIKLLHILSYFKKIDNLFIKNYICK